MNAQKQAKEDPRVFADIMNRLLRTAHEDSSDSTILGGLTGGTLGLIGSQLALAHFADAPWAVSDVIPRSMAWGAPLLGALAGAMIGNRIQPVYQIDHDPRRGLTVGTQRLSRAQSDAMRYNSRNPDHQLDDDTRRDEAVSEPLLRDLDEFVTSTS